MIIAIDGTLASGKGVIGRRLAEFYGISHLDTGALYRAVGFEAIRHGIEFTNVSRLAHIASEVSLSNFSDECLRTSEVALAASKVATIPKVRVALLDFQRNFAKQAAGAILDGRDIGTVVCPDADVKLWVQATIEVRAKRRWQEFKSQGRKVTLSDTLAELKERDARDRSRGIAPMIRAPDSYLIDTSKKTINEAVETAREYIDQTLSSKS